MKLIDLNSNLKAPFYQIITEFIKYDIDYFSFNGKILNSINIVGKKSIFLFSRRSYYIRTYLSFFSDKNIINKLDKLFNDNDLTFGDQHRLYVSSEYIEYTAYCNLDSYKQLEKFLNICNKNDNYLKFITL